MRLRSTLVLVSLAFIYGFGQTCSIDADSIVCKDELISFAAVSSAGATGYAWTFGDGGNASSKNISKSYSTVGKREVTLTVTFSGGGTCLAKDSVNVHDLPTADFLIDASTKFCFSQHEICLKDQSSMGSTTTGYDKTIVLWGDGGSSTENNPTTGFKICYTSYPDPDEYTLTVEVTNDKGCEDIWQKVIEVQPEFIASFEPKVGAAGCAYQTVCLKNDSANKPALLKRYLWDFGEGTVDSTHWSRPCAEIEESKKFTASFSVELTNGCKSQVFGDYTTAFQEVLPDVSVQDTGLCYPMPFVCQNAAIFFATYNWFLIDVNGDTVDNAAGYIAELEPPLPGTYFVAGNIRLGDCDTSSPWVQVESLGIKPGMRSLNASQCASNDTVYFVNTSIAHPSAIPDYLWRFYDTLSPSASNACSTARNNCNFDTVGPISKHLYEIPDCYYPTIIAYDIATGCIDSFVDTISRVLQDYILFEAGVGRPCYGGHEEYMVGFSSNLCRAEILISPDTNCGVLAFEEYKGGYLYGTVCDSNGYVSPAFRVVQGEDKVYRSADTNDFYIDQGQVCVDTVFYENMFKLNAPPSGGLSLTGDHCIPAEAKWTYTGVDTLSFAYITYFWNDTLPPQTDSLFGVSFKEIKHTYLKPKDYGLFATLEDTNRCLIEIGKPFPLIYKVGYFNTFKCDTIVCPGKEVQFWDSVYYWFDGYRYWRDTSRLNADIEYIAWDFGDGGGFTFEGPTPKHTYTDRGTYTVRMATRDQYGCTDTAYKVIEVGGVNAVIKTSVTEFLCDQIVQFFDSSYSNFDDPSEKITDYWWSFGDNTNNSKLKDPFHYYDQNGYFTLTHAIGNAKGCTDTTSIEIYLRGPQPYFDFIGDTIGCAPLTIKVDPAGANISEYVFHFNDINNTTLSTNKDTVLSFTYTKSGIYDVYLEASDSFYNQTSGNYYTCKEQFPDTSLPDAPIRQVIVLETPPADFTFPQPICAGQQFNLTSTADTVYKEFRWLVDNNGVSSNSRVIPYTFSDSGSYTIIHYPYYIPTAPYFYPCYDTIEKTVFVSSISADYVFDQVDDCAGFQFNDQSEGAVEFAWDFDHILSGDENFSDKANPSHSFSPDTGWFNVCLTVKNQFGCLDDTCMDVKSSYRQYASFPNVFTPAGDGLNDVFDPAIDGEDVFDLEIFNRWGELVFKTNSSEVKWNGSYMNTGDDLPSGTYYYVLKYRFECTGEEDESHGIVDLIRQ